MRLVEYTPGHFEALRRAAADLRLANLCHRPFVDHYYAGNPWCKLYLVLSAEDTVTAMMGVDRMRFVAGDRELTLGFGSNYHAAQPAAAGHLYLHWLKTCPLGFVFGGSEHTHRILRRQRWTYFPGVKTFTLNSPCAPRPGEPLWRQWAKRFAAYARRMPVGGRARRIPARVRAGVSVHEEQTFTEDLLPRTAPFSFRFAPTVDYLAWRYRPGLSFARYRLFRILVWGSTAGYVVLNDLPGRVLVAQCDGEDAFTLAHGVLLSLVEATAADTALREVVLTSSHSQMQRIYQRFGFRTSGPDRPFAVGSLRPPVDLPADTFGWLVNFDWGDNGLRAPFPDQGRAEVPELEAVQGRQEESSWRSRPD